jgi:hypothetical protein
MTRLYGADFARAFLEAAKSGKADLSPPTYWQVKSGPSHDDLLKRGYQLAGKFQPGGGIDVDVYVHPSGRVVWKDVSTFKWGTDGGGAIGSPQPPSVPGGAIPEIIDPNSDRNRLFGEVVAVKEGIDAGFGTGDMVLYKNGAMELFLEGSGGKSYVFVPVKERPGLYTVYDPTGHKLSGPPWRMPPEEIPDPAVDGVDD